MVQRFKISFSQSFRKRAFLRLVIAGGLVLMLAVVFGGWTQSASAAGGTGSGVNSGNASATSFISAPNRVDMVYDDSRGVLYITSGGSVLRYSLHSKSFLPPFELGGDLKGIDLSLDGNTLAVADHDLFGIHLISLITGLSRRVTFTPASSERGTFAVAFGMDNSLLITSSFNGSGWVPLRKYNLVTGAVTDLGQVRQDTMVSASADGSVIGFAESNESDGPFGRYRVADGNMLRKSGYADGTGWYNYEVGVNRIGSQYAIPTYGGTFITDRTLTKYAVIGDYAGGQPVGVAYNPVKDVVYFPWAQTSMVYAYDTNTLQRVASYDFGDYFDSPGNHAFQDGRLKVSRDGRFLFSTVQSGVRYVDLAPETPECNDLPVVGQQLCSLSL